VYTNNSHSGTRPSALRFLCVLYVRFFLCFPQPSNLQTFQPSNVLGASLANLPRNLYPTGPEESKSPFMPDLSPELLAYGFIWYITFLFSTTCHEAAHALVAKIGGDTTAALGGQVSLNPVPHIQREPWGMVVIPLISFAISSGQSMFGWASAPYDPLWERRHPHRSAWMALAGPAANYTLMLLAVAGLRIGTAMNWIGYDPTTHHADFAMTVLLVFFTLNLLLGTFNLMPVPPLDGSTAIMLLMSEKRAFKYLDWLRGNSYAMLGLLLAYFVFIRYYHYVESFAFSVLLRR
jgi:Zn-dependent protease